MPLLRLHIMSCNLPATSCESHRVFQEQWIAATTLCSRENPSLPPILAIFYIVPLIFGIAIPLSGILLVFLELIAPCHYLG